MLRARLEQPAALLQALWPLLPCSTLRKEDHRLWLLRLLRLTMLRLLLPLLLLVGVQM